jgi:hypothetical protein
MTATPSLADLVAHWRTLGVDTDMVLKPGLEPGQVRERLASLTATPPEELLDWFGTADGAVEGTGFVAAPSGRILVSVDRALHMRASERTARQAIDPALWRDTWLPLTDNLVGEVLAVDVVDGSVWQADGWDADGPRQIADSLTSLLRMWIQYLSRGLWSWTGYAWMDRWAELPAEERASGVVG